VIYRGWRRGALVRQQSKLGAGLCPPFIERKSAVDGETTFELGEISRQLLFPRRGRDRSMRAYPVNADTHYI
jgi:hypothetical protein